MASRVLGDPRCADLDLAELPGRDCDGADEVDPGSALSRSLTAAPKRGFSLTTDLSRISGSFVIARNTAYSYNGRAFDVTKIGRELNARFGYPFSKCADFTSGWSRHI